MSTDSSATADLLARAEAARAGGREEAASRLYDEAATRCRAEDDLEGWTRAVLGAASVQVFGSEPGRVPALLYDVLARTTDDGSRSRLAAALARCWVYAGQAARAAPFADEAVERAQRVGDPGLTADALDAALAVHWGPDELGVRRSLASRLDDVAAHVLDPDARLQAHLWGLQVACEALDLQAMYRQIRALELLGEESPRALFFAASRRLMLDLLRGRIDTSTHLREVAAAAGERSRLADAWMVVKAMDSYSAAQSGDVEKCATGAQACEEFAVAEGIITVCAEAAYLWVAARRPDRARALVSMFHGDVLDELPRDVNWLLTLQCVLEVALAVDDQTLIEKAAGLLAPYDGRAVFNAGAVMFHGTTDDTLSRALPCWATPSGHRTTAPGTDHLRADRRAVVARPAGLLVAAGRRVGRRRCRPGAPASHAGRVMAHRPAGHTGRGPARFRLPARVDPPTRAARGCPRPRRRRHRGGRSSRTR